ncbi:uncharacterized protein [Gossypium hirsutum]|uniref:Uncharacterized protein isoform X2 n=1 Tax=Gossypium hirsutum TaxID=3635 RepID=A0A1U8K9N8_GOSHI|nr:uncharacterized protein LOC107914706 isoform X2 [Gossypium hirsutum]
MNSFRKTFSKHSGSHFLSVHQPPPHLCLIISISQLRLPSSSFCSIDRFSTISSAATYKAVSPDWFCLGNSSLSSSGPVFFNISDMANG